MFSLHLSEAAHKVVREFSFMVEEGSFPLGPEREVAGCAPHEHLGGGQHVEGAGGCPALSVLVVHSQAHLHSKLNLQTYEEGR